jgi:hypothetical protein
MKVQKTPCLGGVEVATVGAMDRRPPGPSAAGRWLAILVVAAALVFGVTSCSNDDDDPKGPTATVGTSPPTSKPTTSTTTIEDVEAEVEAAYLEAEAAYQAMAQDPDPSDPRIPRHFSGQALELIEARLDRFVREGIATRYSEEGPPRSTTVSVELVDGESRAIIRTCVVNDVVQFRTADGSVINDSVSTSILDTDLEARDGRWLVFDRREVKKVKEC